MEYSESQISTGLLTCSVSHHFGEVTSEAEGKLNEIRILRGWNVKGRGRGVRLGEMGRRGDGLRRAWDGQGEGLKKEGEKERRREGQREERGEWAEVVMGRFVGGRRTEGRG